MILRQYDIELRHKCVPECITFKCVCSICNISSWRRVLGARGTGLVTGII